MEMSFYVRQRLRTLLRTLQPLVSIIILNYFLIKSVQMFAFDILYTSVSVIKFGSSYGSLFITGRPGAQICVYHLLPRRPAEEQSEEDL